MKFLGAEISYKDVDIFKMFGWGGEYGMTHNELTDALEFFNIKFKRKDLTTSWDVSQALKRCGVVIIAYQWFTNYSMGAHFAVLYKNNNKTFKGLNIFEDGTQFMLKDELDEDLKKTLSCFVYKPQIWEILND